GARGGERRTPRASGADGDATVETGGGFAGWRWRDGSVETVDGQVGASQAPAASSPREQPLARARGGRPGPTPASVRSPGRRRAHLPLPVPRSGRAVLPARIARRVACAVLPPLPAVPRSPPAGSIG